jgi:hypothetical protein
MGDRLVQPLRLGIHLHGLPRLALEDHGKTDRRCAGIFPITGHQAPFLRPSSFSSVIPIPPWPAMAPREADPSFKRTIHSALEPQTTGFAFPRSGGLPPPGLVR